MEFEKEKVVKIDRTSPMSMEYYVQVIKVFGARPMYHFEKKSDALLMAKALKDNLINTFNDSTKEEQNKAFELLKEYDYSDESKKSDMFVGYV